MIEQPSITRDQAVKMVLRFQDERGFPPDTIERDPATGKTSAAISPGQERLIKALQGAARGMAHAERIMTLLDEGVRAGSEREALDAARYCPKPVDIYHAAIVLANRVPDARSPRDVFCDQCQDTGWLILPDGAVRCRCIGRKSA